MDRLGAKAGSQGKYLVHAVLTIGKCPSPNGIPDVFSLIAERAGGVTQRLRPQWHSLDKAITLGDRDRKSVV